MRTGNVQNNATGDHVLIAEFMWSSASYVKAKCYLNLQKLMFSNRSTNN